MTRVSLGLALLGSTALAGSAAAQQEPIQIVGSSTVYPFATVVAENFGRETEYPTPVLESTGSGGGLQIFCEGTGPDTADITNASRRIQASEVEMCESNGVDEIREVVVGYDGIVLANSVESSALDLTPEQLWMALAKDVVEDGEVVANPYTRWSEIDSSLPDAEIEVFGPPPTSGTRDAFGELVMEAGCADAVEEADLSDDEAEEVCVTMREDGRFIEAGENDNAIVQDLQANPEALGIFGFSFLDQNRDVVQGTAIDGVEPTFEAIAEGDYPVSRSLYFYVKLAHVGETPGLREYVESFVSEEATGQEGYLVDVGLIPLPPEMHAEQREAVEQLTASDFSELTAN
ncbi:MAG: substrate-binding domain-containing protein [Alphaproteobacteria bacterium]